MRLKEIAGEMEKLREQLQPYTTLQESIGSYINDIEGLNTEQKNLLMDIIHYTLNPQPASGLIRRLNNSTTILALNSIQNAINQLPDLVLTFYKDGWGATIEGLKNKRISVKDLGLTETTFDFVKNRNSPLKKFLETKWGGKEVYNLLQKVNPLTLLETFDVFGKNSKLNARLINAEKFLK